MGYWYVLRILKIPPIKPAASFFCVIKLNTILKTLNTLKIVFGRQLFFSLENKGLLLLALSVKRIVFYFLLLLQEILKSENLAQGIFLLSDRQSQIGRMLVSNCNFFTI